MAPGVCGAGLLHELGVHEPAGDVEGVLYRQRVLSVFPVAAAALLPCSLPLSLRHLSVCETGIDTYAIHLDPLIAQFLPKLDK